MDIQPKRMAALSIIATPIGNLGDITLRALETLKAVDVIACEDTRVSGKLLSHYGIATPMLSYQEHNAQAQRPKLLAMMQDGKRVALISDAGTPLISDPGYKLVVEARAAGLSVSALPGASSVMAALASSGQPTDRFLFLGFLPQTVSAAAELLHSIKRVPATLVVFTTGPKFQKDVATLREHLGDRSCTLARELTKLFEDVRSQPLSAWGAETRLKGEIVLVIAPPADEKTSQEELDALLEARLKALSLKDAVAEVASLTGLPKKEVYARALELKP